MTAAILFWCYKSPEVCVDRVRLLRRRNPASPIYVLYGGRPRAAAEMERALAPFVDDFWSFDQRRGRYWKWRNGDRLIARWHQRRGRVLPGWSRLFVVQWDMLVAAPLSELLHGMPEDAAVFTGRLDLETVRGWWMWVRGPLRRAELALFRLRLRLVEGYAGPVYTAPFIVVSAPRAYFDRLADAPLGRLGFIEYRCPTLAEAWGFPHWSTPQLEAWRPADPATRDAPEVQRAISPIKTPVRPALIRAELSREGGRRVFHPVIGADAETGLSDLPRTRP